MAWFGEEGTLVDFRILGPLEVLADGRPLAIAGPRQRAVLGALLLRANEVVSSDRLVDAVWGMSPPPGAAHALQETVSKLRRSLRPSDARVRTVAGGYAIDAAPDELDATRFRALVDSARVAEGDAEHIVPRLRAALALWRGAPLADVGLEDWAAAEKERLEELRLWVLDERIDAELALGRHAGLVGELRSLALAPPFRERSCEQLMLALYRSGRQAEALAAFRDIRQRLKDELGLDPGPDLRRLEQAILRHDPTLDVTSEAARVQVPLVPPRRTRRRVALRATAMAVVALGASIAGLAFARGSGSQAVFADSMRGRTIDAKFWDVSFAGQGSSATADGSGVELALSPHAAPPAGSRLFYSRLASYCWLTGPFDIQVDYALRDWPPRNGSTLQLSAAYADAARVSEPSGAEVYEAVSRPQTPGVGRYGHRLATRDTSGTLRLVRSGPTVTEYARQDGRWRRLLTAPVAPYSVYPLVQLSSTPSRFAHREVRVSLSNFRVTTGSLSCLGG